MGDWRTLGLSDRHTVMGDGTIRPAPQDWHAGGIGELLNKVAPRYGRSGALVLDRSAAALLGLPVDPEVIRPGGKFTGAIDHPAVDDARRSGWNAGRVSDWTTFSAPDRPTLHVGIEPLFDIRPDKEGFTYRAPFWRAEFHDTVRTLDLWHLLSGVPWRGTPGMAGMAMLREHETQTSEKEGRYAPTWHPKPLDANKKPLPYVPDEVYEPEYRLDDWAFMPPCSCYLHGYDTNRAYIAAAMLAEVAPYTLKHTGRIPFSKRTAGWWQVELAPWNIRELPDPAGYHQGERVVWMVTQRLELLESLTTQGIYGGVRILDSWTGPARDSILRPMAERLRDMYLYRDASGAALSLGIRDQISVQDMTKQVGREVLGMLNSPTNWCYRPDWWYAIVALQAANLWRKLHTISVAEKRYPARIDVDNVYYPSSDPNPVTAAPRGLLCRRGTKCGCAHGLDPSGERLGHFKPKKTYRYKTARPDGTT